jgi:hypothetical protein
MQTRSSKRVIHATSSVPASAVPASGNWLHDDEVFSEDSDTKSVSDLFASDDEMPEDFVWEVDPSSIAQSDHAEPVDIMQGMLGIMPGQLRMRKTIASLETRALALESARAKMRHRPVPRSDIRKKM